MQASPPALRAAAMPTVGEMFEAQVRRRPQQLALQMAGRTVTYSQLDARVNSLAALVADAGVKRGDRIAVLSENSIEYVQLLLAAAKLGVICVCLNWRLADGEQSGCIALVEPKLVFVSQRFREKQAMFGAIPVRLIAELEYATAAQPQIVAEPEDGLHILFTSGTTGQPKAALISHRALIARGTVSVLDGGFQPGRTLIAWAPMFHQMSTDNTLVTLSMGGKVVIVDGLQVDAICDALESEKNLGWLGLTPGMVDEVLARMRERGIPPPRMDSIGCMADLLPRARIAEITTLFNAPFRNTFGLTEGGSAPASGDLIAIGVVPDDLDKIETAFCRVRLVGEDGADVKNGEPGELLLRSPTLFSGYWNMPKETAEVFEGGWYRTGDVFVRQPSGKLAYVDRKKYLIKSGGENIYPAEIEQVLRKHPGLGEVVVVRSRDERWGEVPVAFVVREDPNLSEEEIIGFCRGKIAGYKMPKAVRFIRDEDIPRNVTGKVVRKELEALLQEEK